MRVIVTGLGKTGTTGIASMLKNALGLAYNHEPKKPHLIQALRNAKDVVVKVNIFYIDDEIFNSFDKKIIIHRDPRDRFISGLLFNLVTLKRRKERVLKLVDILKEKEADPTSWSVKDIWEALYIPYINEFSPTQCRDLYVDLMKFTAGHPDYYQIKYEDWIDNKLDGLEEYMGHSLIQASRSVPSRWSFVIRSKRYDDWRHWFLPEDIEYFKPLFEPYMKFVDYTLDWDLAKKPIIEPEFSSLYVRRICQV